MRSQVTQPVKLGVVGLGRAFMLTLPALRACPDVVLTAACDPRPAARETFEREFKQPAYDSVNALCQHSDTEAVYIATPHALHAQHVTLCAAAGKHVLVEKPLSISLDEGQRMIQACHRAGIHLIVGPCHSFDIPVTEAKTIIDSKQLGAVKMIHALNYTDFLYRPRRTEELQTGHGGGVIFSQAVHQVDIIRSLVGQRARHVVAMTGAWDPNRSTEGSYAALVSFHGGAFASLVYSGYGHFDSDMWQGWVSELGHDKSPSTYGSARRTLARLEGIHTGEAMLKELRTYGEATPSEPATHNEHFGPVIVSCELGDIHITPDGLWIYSNHERKFTATDLAQAPRSNVIQWLVSAVRHDNPPNQVGTWGLASLEICCAMLESAHSELPIMLRHQ